MKEERLLNVFGEVDDKFIESSAPKNVSENTALILEQAYPKIFLAKSKKHSPMIKITSIAAVCATVMGIVFAVKILSDKKDEIDFKNPVSSSDILSLESNVPLESASNQCDPIHLPAWEELKIYEKYDHVLFNDYVFLPSGNVLSKHYLGDFIGNTIACYGARFNDKQYQTNVSMYLIKSISQKFAVAVKFSEDENYYISYNTSYNPQTMKDLIEDFNLRENLTFGEITYITNDNQPKFKLRPPDDYEISITIWENLLREESDTDVKFEYVYNMPDYIEEHRLMDGRLKIEVCLDVLNITNYSIEFLNSGYIYAESFLGSPIVFNIGENEIRSFRDYIMQRCDEEPILYSIQKGNTNSSSDSGKSPKVDSK